MTSRLYNSSPRDSIGYDRAQSHGSRIYNASPRYSIGDERAQSHHLFRTSSNDLVETPPSVKSRETSSHDGAKVPVETPWAVAGTAQTLDSVQSFMIYGSDVDASDDCPCTVSTPRAHSVNSAATIDLYEELMQKTKPHQIHSIIVKARLSQLSRLRKQFRRLMRRIEFDQFKLDDKEVELCCGMIRAFCDQLDALVHEVKLFKVNRSVQIADDE